MRALVLAATLAAVAAPAAAAAPKPGPAQLARAALLRARDLGGGWSQSAAAPAKAPALACPHSGGTQVVRELARAASATFAQDQRGPFASELTAVFASPAASRSWWVNVVRPGLARCFESELKAASSGSVTFKPTGSQLLALRNAPPGLVRYRVTGQATSSGQSTPVDFDVLLLRRGAYVAELQLSSFEAPPADVLEARLARAVARRLPAR